jgi:hypothetical protein
MSSEIIGGVAVFLIGAIVVAMVKNSLNSLKLELQNMFVTKSVCQLQHEGDAREREDIRKNVQNHEDRLNAAKA